MSGANMNNTIPEGLSREALFDLHNHLLDMNPTLRVNQRWGDFTEYSVRLRAKDAASLLGCDVDGNVTWRLVVGVDERDEQGERSDIIDVDYHDGEVWRSACYSDEDASLNPATADILLRCKRFTAAKYPVIEELLEIDRRLLQ
jgi:hypothetical protein